LQENIREYSQGSIQSFEVISASVEGGLSRKVGVRVEDFKAYMRKVAVGETQLGDALSPTIKVELDKQKVLEDFLYEKIGRAIILGEVQNIMVGQAQTIASSGLPEGTIQGRDYMNPAATVVFPVRVALKPEYQQNLLKTLENTAARKTDLNWQVADSNFTSGCWYRKGGIVDPFAVALFDNRRSDAPEYVKVYGFDNVRPPHRERIPIPDLRLTIFDKAGDVLQDFTFNSGTGHNQKHFVLRGNTKEYSGLHTRKPWQLIGGSTNGGPCFTVLSRSDFYLVVELNPDTLSNAGKIEVKYQN
jgi:hypothetical protein